MLVLLPLKGESVVDVTNGVLLVVRRAFAAQGFGVFVASLADAVRLFERCGRRSSCS
ncbi:MAG: hypothetical protein WDO69_04825 [Pseudomonadota bacterium]